MTMQPLTISACSAMSPCKTTSWYQVAKSCARAVMGDSAIAMSAFVPICRGECFVLDYDRWGDFQHGGHGAHGGIARGRSAAYGLSDSVFWTRERSLSSSAKNERKSSASAGIST